MKRNSRHRRRVQLLGAGLIAVIALAGCGSSQSTSTAGASAPGAPPAGATGRAGAPRFHLSSKVVACLKSHGVTLGAARFGSSGGAGGGGPRSGATGQGEPPPGGVTGATGHQFKRPPGGFHGGAQSSKFRIAMQACGVNFGAPSAGSPPSTSSS